MNQQERVSPRTAAPAEGSSCSRLSPWVLLISALAVKTALMTVGLVVLFHRICGQYKTLPQNASEWHCITSGPASQKDSWKCCPEGWRPFQESCYYFSDDQMPWDKSQQNCSGMDSQLVVINTKAEQDFLYKEIGRQMKYQQHSIHLYIGLRAQEVGQWRWVDQTPYNETAAFWRPGEPSDDPNELCVVISYHKDIFRNWNDVPCRIHSYRICENAAETL
ncbi:C-type lectin domain family 4 member D-like [Anas platyrhynchos]|uniref:Dendritic cell immunoactivating receptor isoform 1 n=1 Tax=Anas platyrhynchos TaxID=8839 RepID=A3QWY9_ANAPL|nr:dendritic cell immunoactivating receptor isoform 1 [Anas platyrhynchos]